jgi:tetratricopeptide (TPR) repeat protein
VRAALAWSLEHDAEQCLRIAVGVNRFSLLHGYLAEAQRWLETALAHNLTAPAYLRVRALEGAGAAARIQGDLEAARRFSEQGLSVATQAGSLPQMASATCNLAAIAIAEGDLATARAHLDQGLAFARETGHTVLVATVLNSLGEVARTEGDLEAAKGFFEQATTLCRQERVEQTLSVVLCNLGAVLCAGVDLDAARACYEEALETSRALGSKEFISLSLDGLGAIAAKRGMWERAARLAGAAEGLLDAIGAMLEPVDHAFRERYVADIREHLGEARLEAAMARGRAMTLDEAVREASEFDRRR